MHSSPIQREYCSKQASEEAVAQAVPHIIVPVGGAELREDARRAQCRRRCGLVLLKRSELLSRQHLRVVVAFVDLQVYALLYAGFLQEA